MISIALINPPDTVSENKVSNTPPPLGLAYIAAVLRGEGYPTDIFDFANEDKISTSLLKDLGFFNYTLYGFTAYTKTFRSAINLLGLLRQYNKTAYVVFGGPHVTPCANEILQEYHDIDFIIRNEGENSMLLLTHNLNDNLTSMHEIEGIVYRSGGVESRKKGEASATGKLVYGPDHPKELNKLVVLDNLPFPIRDYKYKSTKPILETRRHRIPVEVEFVSSSRGCPKRCTFCSIVVMSPVYRFRSVSSLMKEIKMLYDKKKFGHISFVDANFFVNSKRTLEFSRSLYEWNRDITWSGTATADTVVNHSNVLKEVGMLNCAYLEIGIESGSSNALKRYNKWTNIEQNFKAIKLLRDAEIELELDFIMFDPETSLDDLLDNLDFLKEAELIGHHPMDHLFNALKIYPGTPSRSKYIEMFNLSSHHMMKLIPPFRIPIVETFYKLVMTFYYNYQSQIDKLLYILNEYYRNNILKIASGDLEKIKENQLLAALIIRIRHLPYHFFEHVLENIIDKKIKVSDDWKCIENTQMIRIIEEFIHIGESYIKDKNFRDANMILNAVNFRSTLMPRSTTV